jgi:hypothetical protein
VESEVWHGCYGMGGERGTRFSVEPWKKNACNDEGRMEEASEKTRRVRNLASKSRSSRRRLEVFASNGRTIEGWKKGGERMGDQKASKRKDEKISGDGRKWKGELREA